MKRKCCKYFNPFESSDKMINFIEEQQNLIKNKLLELNYEIDTVELLPSSRRDLGQYQFNGIMSLGKKYQKNPREIASELVDSLKKETNLYSSVSLAGPGFINLTFSDSYLKSCLQNMKELNKKNSNEKKYKIIMDYGGPNVAKTLHVGHLRSANIGESLKRLAKYLGYEVISDVHLGDWGRPMGLIILELSKQHPDWPFFDPNYSGEYPKEIELTNQDLERLYPIASQKAKEDEKYLEEAREITAKLQQKETGYYELWKRIVEISKKEIKKIYDMLNVSFNLWNGESDSDSYIPEVLDYLTNQNLLYESEGALVMNVQKEEDKVAIPPVLLQKSNGSISYETTDLATIWERIKKYAPDEIWYVVDNRQKLHFEQVFRAAYLSKIAPSNVKLKFLGFGTMNGTDGRPFKTRDGGVMTLFNLIDLIKESTAKQMNEEIEAKEREQIIEDISIANLKYADLLSNRSTDYVFDPQKFSDTNGKTGVYILYSTIRIRSLLKKATLAGEKSNTFSKIAENETREIILKLLELPNTLNKSFSNKSLSEITDYLYHLTNLYNSLYANYRILTNPDAELKESYLYLSKIVLMVNETLLNILGISIPNKI